MSLKKWSFDFTSCKADTVDLDPGSYFIEVWGAGSGNSLGGYASGVLRLDENVRIFIHVGENGNTSTRNSCGGGGYPLGAGSTDVRILKDDLYHRILVGGGASYAAIGSTYGGGINGSSNGAAEGGTQDRPGEKCVRPEKTCYPGSFYFGGNSSNGLGGAGGWFGGAAVSDVSFSGGSGSGYVFAKGSFVPPGYNLPSKYHLHSPVLDMGGLNHVHPKDRTKNGFVNIVKFEECKLLMHSKNITTCLVMYSSLLS